MMLAVSDHACERYAERAMGVSGEDMTPQQYTGIRNKILAKLTPAFYSIKGLGEGEFSVDGIRYLISTSDGTLLVVTIKHRRGEGDLLTLARVRGGKMQSGSKVKKQRNKRPRSERHERDR